jgi:quercetin dioxygenase-like cupin family protein
MRKRNIKDFWRGWFIGNFDPSLLKTEQFEVGLLTHLKDEKWPKHYHKVGTEYNVLISGRMTVAGSEMHPGDVFVFEPGDIADPIFHEDCQVLCVKTPSLPGDKYEVL